MLVPIVIFVGCFVAGVVASSRWLPDLAAGSTGGIAFFSVCGLLGAALGLVGLHLYSIVEGLDKFGGRGLDGLDKGEIVAGGIRNILWEAGSLLGIAVAVYLLAPRPGEIGERAADAAPE